MNVERAPHAVQDLPSRRWKGEKILRLLDLPLRQSPWRVLEIGTGSGGIAHYLGTHPTMSFDVTSVDVVDVRSIHDGYAFQRVNGTSLPFEDASFDLVISNHVIEHVGDRDAQRMHLKECRRVMTSGGRGYLAVPNRWMVVEPHFKLPLLSWMPRHWRDAYVQVAGKGQRYDCEPLTVTELEDLFKSAALTFRSVGVWAMRETIAIEVPRRHLLHAVSFVPDRAWRFLGRWMPTLVYKFAREADQIR